jgi:periplasmic divalent cation tolerance protein
MIDPIVILSTCSSEEEARKIALLLLERGLAACVNVIPGCHSYYHWQGKIERGNEFLLQIKSSRDLFSKAVSCIQESHSYEVPEILALPVIDGAENYLNWLRSSIRQEGAQEA